MPPGARLLSLYVQPDLPIVHHSTTKLGSCIDPSDHFKLLFPHPAAFYFQPSFFPFFPACRLHLPIVFPELPGTLGQNEFLISPKQPWPWPAHQSLCCWFISQTSQLSHPCFDKHKWMLCLERNIFVCVWTVCWQSCEQSCIVPPPLV